MINLKCVFTYFDYNFRKFNDQNEFKTKDRLYKIYIYVHIYSRVDKVSFQSMYWIICRTQNTRLF